MVVGHREIGIVAGYERDQIIRHALENYRSELPRFRFINNPAFAETNNIYSLWLASDWLKGDSFVCLNADVAFDHRILLKAVSSPALINMIVDPEWREETMKVVIAGSQVLRMSKQISRGESSGTYIGIRTLSADIQDRLFARIGQLIRTDRENEFFNVASSNSRMRHPCWFTSTFGLPWRKSMIRRHGVRETTRFSKADSGRGRSVGQSDERPPDR